MKKFLIVLLALGVCSPAFAQEKKKPDPAEAFKKLDKDSDGKVSLVEFKGKREGDKATKAEEQFKKKDKNSDGFLSLEEYVGKAK